MSKWDQVKKQLEQELADVRRARAELRDQEMELRMEEVALQAKMKLLRGGTTSPQLESLGDRIVKVVGELNDANPARIVDLLRLEDPDVKANSVRAMLGQLVESGAIAKRGRGATALPLDTSLGQQGHPADEVDVLVEDLGQGPGALRRLQPEAFYLVAHSERRVRLR